MNFTNYVADIAQVSTSARLKAITEVLDKEAVSYHFQEGYGCRNLIVEQRNGNGPKYVIGAHYDNQTGTPGANDNASACCILLNLILNLRNSKHNIDFVFFDKEEAGFIGSHYYLSQNKPTDIQAAIHMDMCGMGTNTVLSFDNEKPGDNTIESKIVYSNEALKVRKIPAGDAYTFIGAGIPTIYIINSTDHDLSWYNDFANERSSGLFPDFARTMHRATDTVDTINPEQVKKIFTLICGAFEA